MRRAFAYVTLCAVSLAACLTLYAQTNGTGASVKETFGGNWAGTFEGDASGSMEMTVTPAADEKHTGKLKVTMHDGGGYTVDFRELVFNGKKMKGTYDSPNGDGTEIVMEGTFEGNDASGNWQAREKGGSSQMASGSWKATRK